MTRSLRWRGARTWRRSTPEGGCDVKRVVRLRVRFQLWGTLTQCPVVSVHPAQRGEQVVPFFAFSAPIRRAIYRTNAIESLNSAMRRAVRARGHFPNDWGATKLIYLALRGVERKWRAPPVFWHAARTEFAIHFGERFAMVAPWAPVSVSVAAGSRTPGVGSEVPIPNGLQFQRSADRIRFSQGWPTHVVSDNSPSAR